MAAALGYRIGIDARKFCKNDKSCFYIYVDLLRDRTVQDIMNKIKLMLHIDTSIWLLNGIFYLPPTENVRLLYSGDILQIVEQCEDVNHLSDCLNGEEKKYEQLFPKEKKKRKRKHMHGNSETDINRMDIEAVSKSVEKELNIENTLCEREVDCSVAWKECSKSNDITNGKPIKKGINVESTLCKREVDSSITCNEYSKPNEIKIMKPVEEEFNVQDTLCEEFDTSVKCDEYSVSNEVKSSSLVRSSELDDDLKESLEVDDSSFHSSKNMEKVIQEEDGKIVRFNNDVEHTKKRRRTRVRKHKKKQMQMSENKQVLPPTFKSKVYAPHADVSRTHIRFNEDSDQDEKGDKPREPRVTENAAVELKLSKTPLLLDPCKTEAKLISGNSHLTKWDIKSSTVKLLPNATPSGGMMNGTSDGSEAFAKLLSFKNTSTPLVFERKRSEGETSTPQLKNESKYKENLDFSKYPKLPSVPKEGDVIAFKMLKMDANYTPVISEYIMAKVLSVSSSTFQLLLLILDDGEQCRKTKGKFDLEVEDDESSNGRLNLNWNELYEARLLYP